MKEEFRQSMAWLHTWSGLLVCWVLLLVFAAGTATYYREEISLWMKPELHSMAGASVSDADAAAKALNALQERAPHAERWTIDLPRERNPVIRISWINPVPSTMAPRERGQRSRPQTDVLNPVTGEVTAKSRDTRGGEFFYRLHFDLHYLSPKWARWIVGFCAMFMLVAIISGVITHKRIFKDFFTFRPWKGQRSWLDVHNAAAVLALPFHLMITYTGLVTLMFMYMPSAAYMLYNSDQKTFIAEVFPARLQNGKPSGNDAELAALPPLLEQASRQWKGDRLARIVISHPGDANAMISITRQSGRNLSNEEPMILFNGVTGALMSSFGDNPGTASETRGAMYGLHLAHFANPLLRALFFMCGLAGCAMVASGALLWAVKERQKHAKALTRGGRGSVGLRLVDGLNIGAIAGLLIAIAVYFWANRLLPVGLEKRADVEISCFFIAWAVAAIVAHICPTRRMWQWQLWIGSLLLGGIPLLNALTTASHLGVTLLQGKGLYAVAAFDLTVLMLGVASGYTAWTLGRGNRHSVKSRSVEPAKENGTPRHPGINIQEIG